MVGRFIEQQKIRCLQQQFAQRHSTLLATGQHRDVRVAVGTPQRVHGLVQLGVEVPGVLVVDRLLEFAHLREQRVVVGVGIGQFGGDLVEAIHHRLGFGNPVLDVLQHCLRLIELRLLHQDADREPVHECGFAIGHVVHTSHDLQQTRLARSIGADDPDLGAGQEGERDVV